MKADEKRVIFFFFGGGACCGFMISSLKCAAYPTCSLQLTKAGCCAVLRTIHSKRFDSESQKEFACDAVGGMQKGTYERNLN